jgi:hypothetical protein
MVIHVGAETPEERERRKAALRAQLKYPENGPQVQVPEEYEEEKSGHGRHRKGKGKHAK